MTARAPLNLGSEVEKVLSLPLKEAVALDPATPFGSDAEYASLLNALADVEKAAKGINSDRCDIFLQPTPRGLGANTPSRSGTEIKDVRLEESSVSVSTLKSILDHLQHLLEAKLTLHATPPTTGPGDDGGGGGGDGAVAPDAPLLPRLERLMTKLGLEESTGERQLFTKLFLNSLNTTTFAYTRSQGMSMPGQHPARRHATFEEAGQALPLTGRALLEEAGGMMHAQRIKHFLDSKRKHVTEGVVVITNDEIDTYVYSMAWMANGTTLDETVTGACLGYELSKNEFMSIQSPSVTEIITEEPSFASTTLASEVNDIKEAEHHAGQVVQASGEEFAKLRSANAKLTGVDVGLYNLLRTHEEIEISGEQHGRPMKRSRSASSSSFPPPPPSMLLADALTPSTDGADAGLAPVADAGADARADARAAAGSGEAELSGELHAEPQDAGKVSVVDEDSEMTPYRDDVAYLEDKLKLNNLKVMLAAKHRQVDAQEDKKEGDGVDPYNDPYDDMGFGARVNAVNASKRELRKIETKIKVLTSTIMTKLTQTIAAGRVPRLERLTQALTLEDFEIDVVVAIIGTTVQPSHSQLSRLSNMYSNGSGLTVQGLLASFCSSLRDELSNRRYFYRSGSLIKEGILHFANDLEVIGGDLTRLSVNMDRRLLDYVCGLDVEFSELVDGSHLYVPNVSMDAVKIPADHKDRVVETARCFEAVRQARAELLAPEHEEDGAGLDKSGDGSAVAGSDEKSDKKSDISEGAHSKSLTGGGVLLFHGPSGTGKTMLANAIASMLNKKILLISFPSLGSNAGAIAKMLFREATIHNALVFFDECESVFKSRDKDPSGQVNTMLSEIERYDGLVILATNRAADIDEAMHRRISLAIEFQKPNHVLREAIWSSLQPTRLKVSDDVDLNALAHKYEISGGFIKNAWLAAIGFAVARRDRDDDAAATDGAGALNTEATRSVEALVVTQEDLIKGASQQLRGSLSAATFDRKIVPRAGLDESVVVSDEIRERLGMVVDFEKAKSVLLNEWGFAAGSTTGAGTQGVAVLLHGPSGTGKTLAAEALGYELGQPLKVVNSSSLISKWVGESAKNIEAVFDDAAAAGAVLVFDEAEALFGTRGEGGGAGRHDTANVGVLLQRIATFPSVVVAITNLRDMIDPAFDRRFSHIIEFPKPDRSLRVRLWRKLLPKECPCDSDVDEAGLASRYELTGGQIRSAVLRAATRAVLRPLADRRLMMADLTKACDEEMEKGGAGGSLGATSMYS